MTRWLTSSRKRLFRVTAPNPLRRLMVVGLGFALAFGAVSLQLVRLGLRGEARPRLGVAEPLSETLSRPDLVDRNGRLIATDIEVPSLFADPAVIDDIDDVINKLTDILGAAAIEGLRPQLADRSRRFVWIKRGLSPKVAQRVHDLGFPGLKFRMERKRTYPQGELAGHLIGTVNADNRGLSGIERYLDDAGLAEAAQAARVHFRPAVRLSVDLGVAWALEDELRAARAHYEALGAAGIILDAQTGEILAATSVPGADPSDPASSQDALRPDRVSLSTYELGSVFKIFTVAMALDAGLATLDTIYDVRAPLKVGRFTIHDSHPLGRPLSVRDIFVHSSNVGAGLMAAQAGRDRQQAFLKLLGLLDAGRTEAGPLSAPQLPHVWGQAETITIGFGHGLAVTPLQVAAATAAILNGGHAVAPTLLARSSTIQASGAQVIKPQTSAALRELFRRNVLDPSGTGRRAFVDGLDVGGKTGTAEMAGAGGYARKRVIASFLAAFPMRQPRYVAFVMLFEPKVAADTKGEITAGLNAAPLAARVLARSAPLLDWR